MNQKIFSPLFALLIFVAHLNCVLEHGFKHVGSTGAANQVSVDTSTDDSLPDDLHGCHHNCICKGATLADHFVFSSFHTPAFGINFLAISPAVFKAESAELVSPKSPDIPVCFLPLRASVRCAMLQTFLI